MDKKTKESVNKSLFFTLENGKINKIAEHDFDFDVDLLVPGARGKNLPGAFAPYIGAKNLPNVLNAATNALENVQKVFENAEGIGGGNGLPRLRPYLLSNGLYKGDDKNPFINKLPEDTDVDKVVENGNAKDVKDFIVYAARSKVGCQNVNKFLDNLLKKLRNRIAHSKIDVEEAKKIIGTIQEQIKFLQGQLKDNDTQQINVQDLLAKINAIKTDAAKLQ